EGTARVKMFEKIALVWLVPTHLVRRQRADVETIDARRRHERLDQFRIFGDGGNDESWTKVRRNLSLIDLYDARKGKKKLLHREWVVQLREDHRRQQVRTVVPTDEPFAIAISGGDVACAWLTQTLIDNGIDAPGNLRIDKWRQLCVFVISSTRHDL